MSVSWPTIILPRPVPRVLESTTTSSTWPARWGGWSCREQARVLRVLAMPLVPPPGTERVQAAREHAKKAGEPNGKHRGDGQASLVVGRPPATHGGLRSGTPQHVACFALCSGAHAAPAVDELVLDDESGAREHFRLALLPVGWVEPLKHDDVLSVAPEVARCEGLLLQLRHRQGL